VNKAQQRIKDYLISKLARPEGLTALDHKLIDFVIVAVPDFIGIMVTFSILTWLYVWVYNKYGFERTLIVMLVNLVIAIGQVGKGIREIMQ
jgi:hypothetical protein